MVDQDRLFARLARSTFRSRFRLGGKERQYCLDKGPEIIDRHAADFIRQLLLAADDEMVKAKQSGRNQICMPTLTESAP